MIPVFKPSIRRKDMDAVLTCMVSDSLAHGEQARRLASEVAGYLGLAGGVALRGRDRAVHLALDAMAVETGAKVIISPLAPASYADILAQRGLVPLYADANAENGTLQAREVEGLLGEHPAAIIATASLGFVPDLEALAATGVPLIEDISTAFGANVGERRCGSYGRYTIVSLEPEDIITSGGGALLLAAGKKELGDLKRLTDELPRSMLLADMNAALGVIQLGAVEQFVQRRSEIAQLYQQSLLKTRHKSLSAIGEGENIWFTFPVLLAGGMKDVAQYARKKGVETAAGFQDTIASRLDFGNLHLPNARALYLRCMLFPLYPSLGKQNAAQVSKVLSTLP